MTTTRRRWLQYSLRTILIAVSISCVALAVIGNHYRNRRAAVRAIDELGGSYSIQLKGSAWLRQLVGDDKYFYNLRRISLGNPDSLYPAERPFNDQELATIIDHINVFRGPRMLDFQGSPITDEGLRHLKHVRNLEILWLDSTPITDAGLLQLASISTLKQIQLTGSKVTDEGVEKLRRSLPNCHIDYRATPPISAP